jgi:hypothetical protein
MTPEEAAIKIVFGEIPAGDRERWSEGAGQDVEAIAAAIRSAVLEERERCAGIADEWPRFDIGRCTSHDSDPCCHVRTAAEISRRIRQEAGGERDGFCPHGRPDSVCSLCPPAPLGEIADRQLAREVAGTVGLANSEGAGEFEAPLGETCEGPFKLARTLNEKYPGALGLDRLTRDLADVTETMLRETLEEAGLPKRVAGFRTIAWAGLTDTLAASFRDILAPMVGYGSDGGTGKRGETCRKCDGSGYVMRANTANTNLSGATFDVRCDCGGTGKRGERESA